MISKLLREIKRDSIIMQKELIHKSKSSKFKFNKFRKDFLWKYVIHDLYSVIIKLKLAATDYFVHLFIVLNEFQSDEKLDKNYKNYLAESN
jgi:hypothetical protein